MNSFKPVFVYGTLKSDIPVAYEGLDKFGWNLLEKKKARINGNLYIIPNRAATFPAVGQINTENIIEGELVYINNPIFLYMLDRIESEGDMYNRITVTTTEGEECWIYQWHAPEELKFLIEHGNFQYITLFADESYILGIPLQDKSNDTFKIFAPNEFTIFEVPTI